jgi:hypothetical protein
VKPLRMTDAGVSIGRPPGMRAYSVPPVKKIKVGQPTMLKRMTAFPPDAFRPPFHDS